MRARVAAIRDLGWPRAILLVNALVPLVVLVQDGVRDRLGANPVEFFQRTTGTLTLIFLMLGLAVTPARRLFSAPKLIKVRRMLGLLAFTYACAHLLCYLWFDQWFSLSEIATDTFSRPFILVGAISFFGMTTLAITSTNAAVRRLGGQRWAALHRRVYWVAALGVLHYWLLVKADHATPLLFAAILAGLLGVRVMWWMRRRKRP